MVKAKCKQENMNRMHEFFHQWVPEILDKSKEDPEVVLKKWVELQIKQRDSMVVAQDELRKYKKRAYEVWSRVKDTLKHHDLPKDFLEKMDIEFGDLFTGYGTQLVLSVRRWETLIEKVEAHGGIVKGAHDPVMYCGQCGAAYDLHDFILRFDEAINHQPKGHTDWYHLEDEGRSANFAEWANHLQIPCKCGQAHAWTHSLHEDL